VDLGHLPFPSRRTPVVALGGIVATSEPLAAQAGLAMLHAGGTAADAAVAAAATLTVVEPTSNGIGGDAFALYWDGSALFGLDGSGRAPAAFSCDAVRAAGHEAMPPFGWLPVTVPGAPAAWRDLHAAFGRLPFADVLAPAVRYAERGYPVSPVTAHGWGRAATVYRPLAADAPFTGWFSTFAPQGRAPKPGEVVRLPDHASTLAAIGRSGARAFYEGGVAAAIDRFSRETGGFLRAEDLAAHRSAWVTPLRAGYRGFEVAEMPPATQGLSALLALRILEGLDRAALAKDGVDALHLQIEATKAAMSDVAARVGDRDRGGDASAALLSESHVASRRASIGSRATLPPAPSPGTGGTVYLCAVDSAGRMASFIQSNYRGFGSGIVVPGTGVALQDRGACFSLVRGHPNEAAPGKRPFHTIIPAFLLREGRPVGPFGVMGGAMQPQGHVQVAVREIDQDHNPQAALDAPRFQWVEGLRVALEPGFGPAVVDGLRSLGHEVETRAADAFFGRGQVIRRLASGAFAAGTDFRAAGGLAAY
jgi:gamma-glutamyltranspeptidase/glutathione hydrolase